MIQIVSYKKVGDKETLLTLSDGRLTREYSFHFFPGVPVDPDSDEYQPEAISHMRCSEAFERQFSGNRYLLVFDLAKQILEGYFSGTPLDVSQKLPGDLIEIDDHPGSPRGG